MCVSISIDIIIRDIKRDRRKITQRIRVFLLVLTRKRISLLKEGKNERRKKAAYLTINDTPLDITRSVTNAGKVVP